jgi:hypothetical protein
MPKIDKLGEVDVGKLITELDSLPATPRDKYAPPVSELLRAAQEKKRTARSVAKFLTEKFPERGVFTHSAVSGWWNRHKQ